jgi:hypothetical protein
MGKFRDTPESPDIKAFGVSKVSPQMDAKWWYSQRWHGRQWRREILSQKEAPFLPYGLDPSGFRYPLGWFVVLNRPMFRLRGSRAPAQSSILFSFETDFAGG